MKGLLIGGFQNDWEFTDKDTGEHKKGTTHKVYLASSQENSDTRKVAGLIPQEYKANSSTLRALSELDLPTEVECNCEFKPVKIGNRTVTEITVTGIHVL